VGSKIEQATGGARALRITTLGKGARKMIGPPLLHVCTSSIHRRHDHLPYSGEGHQNLNLVDLRSSGNQLWLTIVDGKLTAATHDNVVKHTCCFLTLGGSSQTSYQYRTCLSIFFLIFHPLGAPSLASTYGLLALEWKAAPPAPPDAP
jgi:hypothetical protein